MTRPQPNLILIFTDQQRWDTLGAYGNSVIRTPNLDRLAREGAVFENAVTPCPICVAARACTVSGYAAGRIRSLQNGRPGAIDERDTLPVHLARAGYRTQAIGKMHFVPRGQTYGFQELVLSEEMRFSRFLAPGDPLAFDDYDRFLIEHDMWGWEKPPEIGYNEIKPLINGLPKEFHVTQWCGDQTVQWLREKRPADQPFFLWTSFVKPHVPYDCPRHLTELYDPAVMPRPWVSDRDGTGKNPLYRLYRRALEFDLYSDEAARRARAAYYANISFIDEQVGRILDTLQQQGLTDNTLVIFTSDHGDLMGDHGMWFKSFGHEGSMHVPLLLRWPGVVKPGFRCADLATLFDVFPTFARAAGVDAGGERPGLDLCRMVSGEAGASREIVVSEMENPPDYMLHLRHKDWKYLFHQNGGFEELYDLKDDPHELVDLAEDPARRGIKRDLRAAAVDYIRKYGTAEIALNENGDLRDAPFKPSAPLLKWGMSPQPYSRMPWDSRVPPSTLSESQRSWFWRAIGGDWSRVLKWAHSLSSKDSKPAK